MKHNDTVLRFVHYNGNFVKIWEHDGSQVFFSGAEVTYVVDGAEYKEFVNYGQSCLSPTVVAPTKSGWEFAGWRKDTVASGSVETSVIMNTEPITLYAVFSKQVTVTYSDMGNSNVKTAKPMYYNNGNTKKASFTLSQHIDPYWDVKGWTTSTSAVGTITYNNATAFDRDSDVTLYAVYHQNIVLTTVANGTSSKQTKVRAYNSAGNYSNPTFTVSNPTKSGATFKGWSTAKDTTVEHTSISNKTLSANATFYAVFTYSDAAMADKRINRDDAFLPADAESQGIYVTLASSVDFSKYYAATIKFGEQYTGSLTLNQNHAYETVYLYAKCGSDKVTLYSDYVSAYGHETSARSGTKTLTFSKTSGSAALIVTPGGTGHCDNCYVNASGTLHGRTVVG